MLNHMWAIESYEDLVEWQSSLDHDDRVMSETLYELVIAASLDEIIGQEKESFAEADELIALIKGRLL